MEGLRELVKECIRKKDKEFEDNLIDTNPNRRRITFIGEMYFVILENGEIKQSESDSILDSLGIEFAFVFIKMNYTPGCIYYNSYLSPIIIHRDLQVLNDRLKIDNWDITFNGQFWGHKPTPISVLFSNKPLNFFEWYSNNIDGSVEGLEDIFKLIFLVFKYRSKTEPEYLKLIHKNKLLIDNLHLQISSLEKKLDQILNPHTKP
jgi:hypothetical protein